MSRRQWSALFQSIVGSLAAKSRKTVSNPNLALEKMEDRTTPAAFVYDGTSSLSIDLDNANESITLTSQGGGNYAFTSTSNFTGTDSTGLTGNGTTSLTITNALALSSISITDSATGTSVVFDTSTGSYVDNLSIALNNAGAGGVSVNQATAFAGAAMSVLSAEFVQVSAPLASDDSISLSAASHINAAANITGGATGVSLTANSGGTATGDTDGVSVSNNAVISTTSNGSITITGKGGSGNGNQNNGVDVSTGSSISANGSGTVSITGTGGSGTGNSNWGLRLSGQIASGSGTISLTGTYGDLGTSQTNSNGIVIFSTSGVSSTSGSVDITATGATTAASQALFLDASVGVGAGQSVTVTADSVWIFTSGSINATSTGTVAFATRSAGTQIDLGGSDVLSGTLVLGLEDAELDSVTAGTIIIGTATSGAATVSSAVSIGKNTNLQLTAAGISQSASLSVAGSTTLNAGTNAITLTQAGNDFTGAVTATGAATQITDTNALTVSLTTSGSTVLSAGGNLVVSGTVTGAASGLTTTTTGTGTTTFGATTVGQNLSVTSVGAVSQTGALSVTGTAQISAAGQAITITQAGNDFTGAVTATGAATQITDANALTVALTTTGSTVLSAGGNLVVSGTVTGAASGLTTTTTGTGTTTFGATTVGQNLSVTSVGAVSQTGALSVTGTAQISAAGQAITITQAGNDFTGAVTATGAATQITDANALTVALTTTGSTVLSAGGNLVVSGTVTGAASGLTTTTTGTGTTTFGATTVGQNLSVTSVGAVSQTGALSVTGTAQISAAGQAITITQAGNDFTGAVTATGAATQITDANALTVALTTTGSTVLSAGGNLVVSGTVTGAASGLTTTTTGTGTTTFGATTVGQNLSVTSVGAVSQTGALSVTGTAQISAAGQAITITQAGNDFTGAVTATGAATQITDANALTVALTTTGSTVLSAGGNLVVSGTVTGAASGLTTTTTGTGTTSFGATTVGQNLSVTSVGAVSQTGALSVTGTAQISAAGQAITITQAGNDFTGAVTATGAATQITDANALTVSLTTTGSTILSAGGNLVASGTVTGAASGLTTTTTGTGTTSFGATTVGQNLSVTSVGAVSQTGALLVTGTTQISAAGQAITLTQAGNDFTGAVTATGAATQITDANALTVSLTTSGSTVLSAGGNLVASGSVNGATSDLTTTTTGTGTTSLGATTVGQNLSVTSVGAVSQTGALSVTGTATIAAGTANIDLDTPANAFSTVTITSGANVTLSETGGFTIGGISGIGAGNIGIKSSGTVAASGAITTTGTITLNGLATSSAIGIAGGAGDVQYATSVFTNLTNGANQIVVGSLVQTGMVTIGGAVSFSDPVVICAPGTGGSVTVNGAITGTGNASVTLSASPTTIFLNADITTAGQPIVLDNGSGGATSVVLGANVTLSSGAGAINVNGTVDGAFSLTLNSTGSTTLVGAVGGTTPLASITTDAGGTLAINGGSVKTTGNQSYGDASVTLGSALTLTTTSNGSITFTGAVNAGGHLVTFNANGTGSVEAKNASNDFGTVTITGAANASLADANAFDFGTSFVANDLSLVAVGAVTQSGPITVNGLAAFQTDSTANITFNNSANAFTTAAFAGKTVQVTNSRNISLAGIGSGKDYDGNPITPPSPDEVATLVTGDLTLKLGSSVLRSADTVVSVGTGVSFVPFRVQGTLTIYSTGQTSVLVTEGSRAGGVVFEGRPLDANGNVQLEADPTGVVLYDLDNFLPLLPDNRNGNSQGKIIVTGQSLNFDNGGVVFTPSNINTKNETLTVGAPTLVPGMRVNLTTSQTITKSSSAKTDNQKFVLNNSTAFKANNLTIGSVNPGKTAVVLNQGSKIFAFKGDNNYANPPATPLVTLAFQQTLLRVKAVDSGSGDTLFILDNPISKNLVNAGTTFQITNEGNPSIDALPSDLQPLTGQTFTIQIPNSPENSGNAFETFFLIDSSQAKVAVTDDFNIQNVLLYSTGPGANNRSFASGPVGKPAGGQAGSSAMGRSGQSRAPGDIQRFDVENRSLSSTFVISGQNVNSLDLTVGNAIAFINGPAPGVGSDQYSQTIASGDVKLGGSLSLVINNADFDPELTRYFTIIDNQGDNPVSGVFEGVPERGIVFAGNQAFTITYKGGDGNDVVLIACNDVPDATGAIVSRPFADAVATGNVISTIGNAVQFTSPEGASRQMLPFLNTGYKGNISASGIDRTGDGITDAIVAGVASPNNPTTLRVIDAASGRIAYTLTPFGPNFRGGMRVSAGIADVDGEVMSVIVVGAGPGSTPRVKVFDSVNGQLLKSFNAFGAGYRGGVTVSISTANVNDPATTGRLVVSSLVNPLVKVFDLSSGGRGGASLITSFNPFGQRVVSMVNPSIQIGNLDDDLTTLEIVVGAGFGRNSVQIFDAANGTRLGGINPFPPAFRGGMRIGLADVDRDGILDIVMAASYRPSSGAPGIASAVYMLQRNGNNDYLFSAIKGAGDNFFSLFTQGEATADFFLGINPAVNRLPGSSG